MKILLMNYNQHTFPKILSKTFWDSENFIYKFSLSRSVNLYLSSNLTYLNIHRLVSFMPFRFPFHLRVLFYNDTWVKSTCLNSADLFILKSFHQHLNFFDKFCWLKEKCSFCSYLFCSKYSEMLSQLITFNHFSCHLSYFSSCK